MAHIILEHNGGNFMKKLIFSLLLFIPSYYVIAEQINVLNIFRTIPLSYIKIKRMKLIKSVNNGQTNWHVIDPDRLHTSKTNDIKWAMRPIDINLNTGYLSLSLFGAAVFKMQIKILDLKHRCASIGVTLLYNHGFAPINCEVHIYNYCSRKYLPLNSKAFKSINHALFFHGMDNNEIQLLKKTIAPYSLYRFNFHEKCNAINIAINAYTIETLLRYGKLLLPGGRWRTLNQEEKLLLSKAIASLYKKSATFYWDKNRKEFK